MKNILFMALAAMAAFASCGGPAGPGGDEVDPGKPDPPVTTEDPEYVRVDETPEDWSGEYLLVYEAQAAGTGAYAASTVLQFDGSANPPLDNQGNIVVLSPASPGNAGDLANITGGEVERTAAEVTVTGGRIAAGETNDVYRIIVEPVDGGGYSIKTTGGYYIGGGGAAGNLSASKTFASPAHVHTISIGDSDSNVTGNAGVTFHKSALIVSGSSSNNALRVNAGTGRFGYWGLIAASGLWGQHPVALYKRNAAAPPMASFSVKNTAMTVGAAAGNADISVMGDVDWTAVITSGTAAALKPGTGSGTGDGTITLSFTGNETGGQRVVKVTISTTAAVAVKSYEVTVTQRAPGDVVSLHPRYVRIVALGDPRPSNDWAGTWMLSKARRPEFVRDYYAEDVLEWIEDLKPNCLERFISGYQGPATEIPRRGGGNMPILEFLNAAITAGGDGCHICPKLDLTWLRAAEGTNNYRNFWEGAQKLYDMELVTPIRSVSLDCWNNYRENLEEQGMNATQQAAAMQEVFDKLREIGYEEIGVNLTGANNWGPAADVLDFVDFNINTSTWVPNLSTGIKNNNAIDKNSPSVHDTYLLYIDYPGPVEKFVADNTPDRMADVYTKNIWPQQSVQGFVFVYSISNAGWDPFAHVTDPNGPYGGKNMYDITKECLFRTE